MLGLNRHVDLSVWQPLGSSVTGQKVRSQHRVQVSSIAGRETVVLPPDILQFHLVVGEKAYKNKNNKNNKDDPLEDESEAAAD